MSGNPDKAAEPAPPQEGSESPAESIEQRHDAQEGPSEDRITSEELDALAASANWPTPLHRAAAELRRLRAELDAVRRAGKEMVALNKELRAQLADQVYAAENLLSALANPVEGPSDDALRNFLGDYWSGCFNTTQAIAELRSLFAGVRAAPYKTTTGGVAGKGGGVAFGASQEESK